MFQSLGNGVGSDWRVVIVGFQMGMYRTARIQGREE